MNYTFKKDERLKSRKIIERLYKEGKSLKAFPLRMVYFQTRDISNFYVQVGMSVPKRNFKKAVDRNRIKRLMRESYRKQKYLVYDKLKVPCVFMISYIGKKADKYTDIENKMKELLTSLVKEITKK